MKKTKLKDVYCVPKNEEEFALLCVKPHIYAEKSAFFWSHGAPTKHRVIGPTNPHLLNAQGRKKITVSKFIDLLEDRIVPWRLEEIGFEKEEDSNAYYLKDPQTICVGIYSDETFDVSIHYDYASIPTSIKTYTELQTLIRFLK